MQYKYALKEKKKALQGIAEYSRSLKPRWSFFDSLCDHYKCLH